MKQSIVLITVSGPDKPGITSELTGILAEGNVQILDIGQAVIHGLLSLSILFNLENTTEAATKQRDNKSVIKDLLFKATELGLKLEFRVFDEKDFNTSTALSSRAYRYAVTLIASRIPAVALHRVTQILAKYRLNIDIIERLSEKEFGCVEMIVSSSQELDRHALKKELLTLAGQLQIDIALQAEGLYRRAKRLVVMDMDSTLIQNEVIDEFARELGVYDEVAEITERAMKGQMAFDESLKLRCQKLKGLSSQHIDRVFDRLVLTPGAEELIQTLRKLGYKIAVISGGFSVIAERFKDRLGLNYAYANQLEMSGGKATGAVTPPIVNAQRKADLLDVIAQQERIHLDQVIAIGDGANDLLMLERAGLGIAFNAKPLVREKAHTSMNHVNLRNVLYLLGISGRDLTEIT